ITVTNPDGGVGSCEVCLEVIANPHIVSVSPATRGQGTAVQMTVSGDGFQDGATAKFSGTGITVGAGAWNSDTSLTLTVTVAAGATVGSRNLTITNPDTGSATCTACFGVNVKPTLTSVTPSAQARGAAHQSVVLAGSGFAQGVVVSFSGTGITASV